MLCVGSLRKKKIPPIIVILYIENSYDIRIVLYKK